MEICCWVYAGVRTGERWGLHPIALAIQGTGYKCSIDRPVIKCYSGVVNKAVTNGAETRERFMELTDREIRGVGFDRYVRRRLWRLLIGGLLGFAWMVLVRWLWPSDPTPASLWVLGVALAVVPYGALLWFFLRASKAGKRFLNEWKDEQASTSGLWDGADYRDDD